MEEIKKVNFKTFMRLLKWAWITLAIWIAAQPIIFLVFKVLIKIDWLYWIAFSIGVIVAGYYIIKVISSYKYRRNQYVTFHNAWVRDPSRVNRSALYMMQVATCSKTTASMLSKEFNVKL